KPVVAALSAGRNRVRLMGREAGIKLDQLILRPVGEADLEREGPGEAEVLRNVVDNNLIHRLGTIWHGCYGIVNRFASETRLTHNEIFDTHWTAIGLDARWNYGGERWSHGNEVAYNHLHHLGLGYHADAGAIYQFGPLDTHIHHNYIHHTRAYPYICGYAAVYLDEQSRGALVEQNLAHDIDWYAYFQHKGVDNVFRNNLGAFARDGFFYRGALNEQWRTNTCEVRGNIYLADDGVAIKQAWEPGLVPPVLRDNLYFSTTGTPLTFAGKSLAQWQAAGQDQGSVVADPGCRDAQGRDFRLAPTTAIQSIGFVPFDEAIAAAGLYGDEAWRALPARLPRRQPTAVWSPAELARLQAFELDFEHLPEGAAPAELRLTREGEATFQVTAEQAASGRRALKCTDRKGLKKPFYPYLMLTSQGYGPARLRFCFDALLPATSPAAFYTELRGTGGLHQVGPSLHFQRDGRLLANGRELARLKLGQWVRVEIELQTGPNAPRQYQLLVRQGDREERQTLNYHADFQDLGWLGICASEDADGTFYLDNLEFTID
ncbi:MAG: right-handed parallel beta-helix repeat-containing protein, partial [Armatimonadetes bacterium]|nr:right-handed parallel beta-helix repeat-containing protein [Armatimonadota bacterium]